MNIIAPHSARCTKHKMADVAGFHPCTLLQQYAAQGNFVVANKPKLEVLPAAEPRVSAKGKSRAASFWRFFMAAFLAVGAFSLANASTTVAYFADTEESVGNILEAIGLDFLLSSDGETPILLAPGIPGESILTDVTFDTLSNDPIYRIFVEQSQNQEVESDVAFCGALNAESTSVTLPYSGALLSLETGTTTTPGPWPLTLTFEDNENISNGDTCEVDLVYRGWAQGASEGEGYQDEERMTLFITALLEEDQLQVQEFTQFAALSLLTPEEEPSEGDTSTTTDEVQEEIIEEAVEEEPVARTGGGGGGEPVAPEQNEDTPGEAPSTPENENTPPDSSDAPDEEIPPEEPEQEGAVPEESEEESSPQEEEPPVEESEAPLEAGTEDSSAGSNGEETPPAEEEQTTEEIVEEIPPANDETEEAEVVEEATSEPEPQVEEVVESTPPSESEEVTE